MDYRDNRQQHAKHHQKWPLFAPVPWPLFAPALTKPELPHPILGDAVESEVFAFKDAAFGIGSRLYARPILERCVPETFPDCVRQECDWWVEHIGEPAYGHPYTDTMRENLYAVMIEALGKAFCIEGYE